MMPAPAGRFLRLPAEIGIHPKAHGGRHPRLDAGGAGLGQSRNRRRGRRAFTTLSQRVYRQFTTVRQAQLGDGPDAQNIKDWRRKAMTRRIASLLFAILLAGALPPPAMAQPAARPLSFASVAQATLQDNLQLRAAAFDVAVAQSQLAQAQGAKLPQANLSGSYTRNQEQPLLADPNVYAASLIVSYPLSTGGNLEARIRLAEANARGAQATYERTKQQIVFVAEQTYLQALRDRADLAALPSRIEAARAGIGVAQSGGAPTFGFAAGYALSNANGLSTTIFGGWLVTLAVTLSVFDGGITQAQIREAQLQL